MRYRYRRRYRTRKPNCVSNVKMDSASNVKPFGNGLPKTASQSAVEFRKKTY